MTKPNESSNGEQAAQEGTEGGVKGRVVAFFGRTGEVLDADGLEALVVAAPVDGQVIVGRGGDPIEMITLYAAIIKRAQEDGLLETAILTALYADSENTHPVNSIEPTNPTNPDGGDDADDASSTTH